MELINGKTLRVRLETCCIARTRTMVAYQGTAKFEKVGSGGLFKKSSSGKDAALVRMSGQGEVYLAYENSDIRLIDLDGSEGLAVNGRNVLAFDASLKHDVQKVKDDSTVFVFTGRGRVAVTTLGQPVVLTVEAGTESRPTLVDARAAVCWSASLDADYQNAEKLGLGKLQGSGGGKASTLSLTGHGFAVVQPAAPSPARDDKSEEEEIAEGLLEWLG